MSKPTNAERTVLYFLYGTPDFYVSERIWVVYEPVEYYSLYDMPSIEQHTGRVLH